MHYYDVRTLGLGRVLATADDDGLTAVLFPRGDRPAAPAAEARPDPARFDGFFDQLALYLAGKLRQFDCPLSLRGTAFQVKVWDAVRSIPYGSVATYRELAARVGDERAARAVGSANGRNPLPVVIPCHRVVGTGGELRGYIGGVRIKEMLLQIERGQGIGSEAGARIARRLAGFDGRRRTGGR